ncbi:MAG: hypothetical protein WCI19_16245 [Betaproteobacteria bacterium]
MSNEQISEGATCGTCRYYREQDHSIGGCHRHPPRFAGSQSPRELHRWCFPLVTIHAWCGEHVPASPASV